MRIIKTQLPSPTNIAILLDDDTILDFHQYPQHPGEPNTVWCDRVRELNDQTQQYEYFDPISSRYLNIGEGLWSHSCRGLDWEGLQQWPETIVARLLA